MISFLEFAPLFFSFRRELAGKNLRLCFFPIRPFSLPFSFPLALFSFYFRYHFNIFIVWFPVSETPSLVTFAVTLSAPILQILPTPLPGV